jgi:hypothetical protein
MQSVQAKAVKIDDAEMDALLDGVTESHVQLRTLGVESSAT